ncbi:hypothetical protein [Streptomyces chartreusis]|uniref:hypothetical protein n=1 Tax=Streptomyces chartreusis TaxID=1969 RepID=UPI003684E7BA
MSAEPTSYVVDGWFHESVISTWASALYASSLATARCVALETVHAAILENLNQAARAFAAGSDMVDEERMSWARTTASRALLTLVSCRLAHEPNPAA